MLPFRRILFPVDYSEPCREIVPWVKEMTGLFEAELTLLHAWESDLPPWLDLLVENPFPTEAARKSEKEILGKFAREMFPDTNVSLITPSGDAAKAIHDAVVHAGTDLIMMPTHGYGPLRRLLLGSNTAKVLHDVDAAVWTGTGSVLSTHQPRIPCRSVLCALEDGEESPAVLKASAILAAAFGAKLSILHILELPGGADVRFDAYRRQINDDVEFWLRELKANLGIDAPHSIRDLPVARAVREEAVHREADLIVSGRGRARGLTPALWSSLYSLMREAPCPVLSI